MKKKYSISVWIVQLIMSFSYVVFADSSILISEFMAKNDSTLIDGNGNYSDWIELYNSSSNSVDLTGWYLSDDADDLTQWTFPTKTIAAGEFLVVFASGEDEVGYTDSLGYLHTNFKLSGGGENIILTQSDGVTIEHAYLDYPDQDDDISYGLSQSSGYSYLVVEEQDATAFVGTSQPSTSWNTPSFSDSGWTSGQTGVGYDKGSTYTSMINLDLESSMMNEATRPPTFYDSAYIRVPFTIDDATGISQLALRMKYDDGFVAYINGTKVASGNAPSSLSYTSEATAEHDGTTYEDFTLLNADEYLQTGDNVLAIQGLCYPFNPQTSSGEPDFFIMPELTGITVGDVETNSMMYLTTPTPGAENVYGILGYVEDTTFTVDRGFFTNSFDLEINCKTDGAEIYYTTDGTTPTANNGTLYSGAITISKTTVLRAAAFKTSYQSSDTDTQTYLFLDDIISQGTSVSSLDPEFPSTSVNGQSFDYGMDTDITQSSTYSGQIEGALKAIPSISIVTDPDNMFDSSIGIYVNPEESGEEWERETSIELINPDGTDGFQINGGIRIRGASSASTSNPKHSFRFFFRSEYGTSRLEYSLFGDEGADSFKRMDLRTGQNFSWANQNPQYATWLYDIFTRDTHRDMNQPYTRGEYYHLYINGMYWGLYQTEERCNADFAESYYGDDDDDFDAVKSDADTGDMYAVDGTRDAYDSLWSEAYYSGFSSDSKYFEVQGMNSDGTENSSYTKLLDVDNVIDYMLLIYFTANRDSPIGPPNQNTMPRNLNAIYNRSNPDGFKFVAHDNEHSLEISEGVNHNRFDQSLSSVFNAVDYFTPWWLHIKLMQNEEYALEFADHVHEYFFNNGALTTSEITTRLETRSNEIYAAVVAESARWGDSVGTLRTRDDDWQDCVDWLLNSYMPYRSAIVLAQIEAEGWYPSVDAPEFNQHGGSISSTDIITLSGDDVIYYTMDGSDPRDVGGSVASTAYTAASGTLSGSLSKSTQIKARVLSGGEWSALTKATFVLDEESPLRVTEIMYNPADAQTDAETGYESSDFEFIEIQNTSDETIGLAGTEFSDGILFDFTDGDVSSLDSGEYAVLVSNYDAFTNRYDNWASINIAGEYHGKFFIAKAALDNSGEDITLVDGLNKTILDFEYKDGWYDITDGEGYSLTLIDSSAETNTWSESTSWRASKYSGGTPGEGPEDFLLTGDLIINEVLTHQDDDTPGDWIEIYNTSTNTIDISGWFVSDDDDNLTMVELGELSDIAPGGYIVLTEASDFGTTVAGTNGFGLSELGETVYLSSGDDGELTGYRIEQKFDAAERDVTFGLYTKSDDTTDFTAQSAQTPGSANAYPLIGDVVFSEIMYHPADSNGYEFIEVCNRSSSAVSLYHSTYTTNTWKLDGAVEYTFPEGTILSSGECLLITETDETTFRNYYTVDAGVTVLGPYDGHLNNSGEDLMLTRPGELEELTGEVPYITVELVEYTDETPWPVDADGLGASLERVDYTLYPNDPENWTANSTPTPGTTNLEPQDDDSDDDGMPDSWEIEYFGSINADGGDADDDWDFDGSSNYDEYIAGTTPTNEASVFAFETVITDGDHILSWSSETGKIYSLWVSTNLMNGNFIMTNSNIYATPPMNILTTLVENADCIYYMLSVEEE